ncbi:MAG: hypothetical protein ACKVZH_13885 [Blastocatellia bacterium]
MDISNTLALLSALSVASERIVETIKGLWPWLNKETLDNEINEGRRKSTILIVAAIAGIVMAWLAKETGVINLEGQPFSKVISLGLLSAGGSGLWNSVQTSLNKLKDATKKLAA